MKKSLIAVVVLVSLLVACGGYGSPKAAPTTAPSGGAAGTTANEVDITARYASFSPSAIAVKRGESITLKLKSADVGHTFTIDELGINISVGAGQTLTREIKFDRGGTFTFYCAVLGHRAAGMEGSIQVP